MLKISVIVLTYNSSCNIQRCLKSVQWADEIVVIDSFSKDNSVELAKSFGAKIFFNLYNGYSEQIEYGVQKAENELIFILDSDEEVSEELKKEIMGLNNNSFTHIGGYEIPRHVFFLGRWINYGGWYPDYQFRLFDRKKASIIHLEVHGSYESEKKERLKGEIYHYTYRNLFDYSERINKYTSLYINNIILGRGLKRVKWYNLILNPFSKFIRMFIFLKGYKDKMPGLILALYSSFYTLSVYAKMWEYRNSIDSKSEAPPMTNKDFRNYNKVV